MPARPASNSMRWTSRSRATAASSSSSVRSLRSATDRLASGRPARRLARMKARARARKLSTVSISRSLVRHATSSWLSTMSARRWRWSAGVPYSARSRVWRRR